jgi:tetratricopeptide (TPR) repeat protein
VLTTGCNAGSQSPPTFESLYAAAESELARGHSPDAQRQIDQALALARDRNDPAQLWRAQLLRAELSLTEGHPPKPPDVLEAELPPALSVAPLAARQRYLRARLFALDGRADQVESALGEARVLAKQSVAVDVLLDADLYEGRLQLQTGRWESGNALLEGAARDAAAHGDQRRAAIALNNLGMGRVARGRFDEALPYFQRVLSLADLRDELTYGASLNNAALCYARLGDFDHALPLHQRAIAAQETRSNRLYLAQAVGELGNTYMQKGDTAAALPYLERAFSVARAAGLVQQASWFADNVAAARINVGDWERAQAANNEARKLKTQAGDTSLVYNTLNDAQIALGRGQLADAGRLFNLTLHATSDDPSLQWLAHAGLADVARTRKDGATTAQEFEATLRTIERTRADLLKTDYKLSYLTPLIRFYRAYVDVLMDAGQRERALEIADSSRARVLAERAGASVPRRRTTAEFRRVAQASGTVLVAYWLGSDRSFAWVVDGAGVHVATLPPASRIEGLVADYQRLLVDRAADPLAMTTTPGDALFAAVVAPIQPYLTAGRPIVLVPDGALHTVNFETLPVPGTPRHYWLEDVSIAVAPSLATLQPSVKTGPARSSAGASVLLVGNAVAADPRFPALHFAGEELSRIAVHFAPASVTRQEGAAATPRAYFAAGPERFAILHFAAHASTSRETPLDSTVILSADAVGYKLYAREVAEHPLQADLVTISACRSAGERLYSGEGLVGFAWAFLRAGARRVVAGLWDVDDRSTVRVMDRLYAGIAAGQPPVTALRDAKLALVRGGGVYAKPYYWAPFQLFTVIADK